MTKSKPATLLEDIQLLIAAHDRLISAKARIRASDMTFHEKIDASPTFAAWLYFKGLRSDDQLFSYIKSAWDAFEGDKSKMWDWLNTPAENEPIPDVDRLLYRIDMAMGLIAQKTHARMPVETVRDAGYQTQTLQKILSFAQAAVDLE